MLQGLGYDSQPKSVTSKQEWVTPHSDLCRKTREAAPGWESRKGILVSSPPRSSQERKGTRGTYPIYPSSSDSSGKMHRIACTQPHLLLQLQLEDYATLSYKDRQKGTGSDPRGFAAFQCSADILAHLPRKGEAQNRKYSSNATCSPSQGALTATEINTKKVPAWRIPPVQLELWAWKHVQRFTG